MNASHIVLATGLSLAVACLPIFGCERESSTSQTDARNPDDHAHDDHDHSHEHADGDSHDHGHDHHDEAGHVHEPGHEGQVVELGAATIGSFSVAAFREATVDAGKEIPISVKVTSRGASIAAAVRIWIGTEDARGSVKARAELAGTEENAHWHAHAEAPNPLAEGSRLWIEIEDAAGVLTMGSFDLGD